MTPLRGFPAVANEQATILILGSMPGQRSLDDNQYYAHPRNAFWAIMAEIFSFDLEQTSYEDRLQVLQQNNIALWDVLKHCARVGSLDSAIQTDSIEVNDFNGFFDHNRNVQTIAFNGAKSQQLWQRFVWPDFKFKKPGLMLEKLPSTSPAYAAMPFEKKLVNWRRVIAFG